MLYLLGKLAFCLALVSVLSFAFGWILRGKLSKLELKRLESVWKINVLSKDLEKEQPTHHKNRGG